MTDTIDPTNIMSTIEDLAVDITELHHYERNPRRGNLGVIIDSLETHGQYKPIVVRTGTGEILAGNHTVMAAKELGWSKIAATLVDVDDDEAARIVLVDNRANDVAGYDDEELLELLKTVQEGDDGLAGTGFNDEDLAELLAAVDPESLEGVEEEPKGDDMPTLSMKMPARLKERFLAALERYDGEHRSEKLEALLDDLHF